MKISDERMPQADAKMSPRGARLRSYYPMTSSQLQHGSRAAASLTFPFACWHFLRMFRSRKRSHQFDGPPVGYVPRKRACTLCP
jgi:hypothetical protein